MLRTQHVKSSEKKLKASLFNLFNVSRAKLPSSSGIKQKKTKKRIYRYKAMSGKLMKLPDDDTQIKKKVIIKL